MDFVEGRTGRTVRIGEQWVLGLQEFPRWPRTGDATTNCPIIFPRQPITAVTAITYLDQDQQSQSFTDFTAVVDTEPGYVVPNRGIDWPVTADEASDIFPNTVQITFNAGVADHRVNVVLGQIAKHWFDTRGSAVMGTMTEVPMATEALLNQISWGDEFAQYGV